LGIAGAQSRSLTRHGYEGGADKDGYNFMFNNSPQSLSSVLRQRESKRGCKTKIAASRVAIAHARADGVFIPARNGSDDACRRSHVAG
jgi:hypothetical protein